MRAQIQHLSYTLGAETLFEDISFVIEDGDKIALVGVNGSGKSSLLKLIAQRSDGVSFKKDTTIAYLPQDPRFDPEMNVHEAALKELPKVPEHEVNASLTRFGLNDFTKSVAALSGGETRRLALAIVMATPCDLMILDEPTNHLDTGMIETLEALLIKRKKALLMVTHDRFFLERVATSIIEITQKRLEVYPGNYPVYLEERDKRLNDALAREHKRKQFLKKELEWVRAGVQARSTKSKDRLQRFEKLSDIEDVSLNSSVAMIDTAGRLGRKTITFDHVSKHFGERTLFTDFSYQVKRFERIGIIGPNGSGKTTLLKMILGQTDYEGTIILGETMHPGHFRQGLGEMDDDMTVLEYVEDTGHVIDTAEGKMTARGLCERFLFDSRDQRTKLHFLSGGEKRRLQFLKVLMAGPNVLLLDEPTNDLDLDTLNVLEDFLDDFKGIVIAVSHDRYFLERICDTLFVFEDGTLTARNEGYDAWHQAKTTTRDNTAARKAYEARKAQSRKPRISYKDRQKMEALGKEIPELESQLKALEEEMNTITDYETIRTLSEERDALEADIEEKTDVYLDLLEQAGEM